MQRGDIWWAVLPTASGKPDRRPVVIVSSDRFNRSNLATVLVLPCTTNLRRAHAPGNVVLAAGTGGLREDSVAVVAGLSIIAKAECERHLGTLPDDAVREIDSGLRLVLDLDA